MSEQPPAKPVKRWSVEFIPKPSYPRAGFWLDVNAVDETGAVTAARQVLIHLWRRDPDAYEYRPIEVEHRSAKDSIDVADGHERVYRALENLHREVEKFLEQEYVVPVDMLAANNERGFVSDLMFACMKIALWPLEVAKKLLGLDPEDER